MRARPCFDDGEASVQRVLAGQGLKVGESAGGGRKPASRLFRNRQTSPSERASALIDIARTEMVAWLALGLCMGVLFASASVCNDINYAPTIAILQAFTPEAEAMWRYPRG